MVQSESKYDVKSCFIDFLNMATNAARSFDFEITRMISDQIVFHSVQLPLYIIADCYIILKYSRSIAVYKLTDLTVANLYNVMVMIIIFSITVILTCRQWRTGRDDREKGDDWARVINTKVRLFWEQF